MKKVIDMQNMVKKFPGVLAVDDSDFTLYEGEIHALIGENGAGKSTMMKMLYGLYEPDGGSIEIKGYKYDSISPKEAISLGVGMVHQEFMLVDDMTVLENIILGFEPKKKMNQINFEASKEKINFFVESYGLDIQLDKKVKDISVGEAQRVEIIKALYRGADILILDEPTAVLTPQETVKLFEILRKITANNQSVIFISHKLQEIMEVSDRVTVMRAGRVVNTKKKEDTSVEDIAKDMIGREVFLHIDHVEGNPTEEILSVNNVYIPGDRELSKIRDLSLSLKAGEILGIAGVDGNGQSELVEAIAGIRKVEKGSIILGDVDITKFNPKKVRNSGLTHIPEDRNKRGLNRSFTINENLVSTNLNKSGFSKYSIINHKHNVKYSEGLIEEFDIRPTDPDMATTNLSGGNAQKIVVAREVTNAKKVLIASHPTRGVDVGSIEFIRKKILEARDSGLGVLLISADLGEIMALSDRIAVMYGGKITGELLNSEANETNLGLLMAGGKK